MPLHICRICGDTLSRSTKLTEHMRSHTGEKPFECTECNKQFARSYDLTKHKELHSDSHRFKCEGVDNGVAWGCGKGFHKKGDLNRHLRRENAEQCRRQSYIQTLPTSKMTQSLAASGTNIAVQSPGDIPMTIMGPHALLESHEAASVLTSMMDDSLAKPAETSLRDPLSQKFSEDTQSSYSNVSSRCTSQKTARISTRVEKKRNPSGSAQYLEKLESSLNQMERLLGVSGPITDEEAGRINSVQLKDNVQGRQGPAVVELSRRNSSEEPYGWEKYQYPMDSDSSQEQLTLCVNVADYPRFHCCGLAIAGLDTLMEHCNERHAQKTLSLIFADNQGLSGTQQESTMCRVLDPNKYLSLLDVSSDKDLRESSPSQSPSENLVRASPQPHQPKVLVLGNELSRRHFTSKDSEAFHFWLDESTPKYNFYRTKTLRKGPLSDFDLIMLDTVLPTDEPINVYLDILEIQKPTLAVIRPFDISMSTGKYAARGFFHTTSPYLFNIEMLFNELGVYRGVPEDDFRKYRLINDEYRQSTIDAWAQKKFTETENCDSIEVSGLSNLPPKR